MLNYTFNKPQEFLPVISHPWKHEKTVLVILLNTDLPIPMKKQWTLYLMEANYTRLSVRLTEKPLQHKDVPILNWKNSSLCLCLIFNRIYLKLIFKSTQINLLHIDAAEISSITFSAKVLKGLINGWVFIFSSSETPYFHPLLVWKRKKKNKKPTEMRTM